MNARVSLGLALVAIVLSAGSAVDAQKPAKATPRLNVFIPKVYAVEPNIEAILMFTDEQKQKLAKALEETTQAAAVTDLKPKKGEAADKAKQAKYKEELTKAQTELKKRVADILTTEQKATVQKVDDALKQALDAALTKEQKEKLEATKKKQKKAP